MCVSVCALMRNRTRTIISRDEIETRKCQESHLKLARAEDNSAKTVFLPSLITPAVSICMCVLEESFKCNKNTASSSTSLLDVQSHTKQ